MDVDVVGDSVDPQTEAWVMGLGVNSLVEVTLAKGNTYGIIRWIGKVPGHGDTMAGLELVRGKRRGDITR